MTPASADLVVRCSVLAVLAAVAANFASARGAGRVRRERRSLVATASMLAFAALMVAAVKLRLGALGPGVLPPGLSTALRRAGLTLVAAGAAVNLLGRASLAGNWSNQVRIYDDHTLVRSGAYALVRHPLYASLIWMFYGAALVYSNWAVFLCTTAVFVPAVRHRAALEEAELGARFPDYADYRRSTGMFFPKAPVRGRREPCPPR